MVFTKKYIAILLVMVMVLSLNGCSTKKEQTNGGSNGANVTELPEEDEKILATRKQKLIQKRTRLLFGQKTDMMLI